MASSEGRIDIVRLLLDKGANTEAETNVSQQYSLYMNLDSMYDLYMSPFSFNY